MLGFKLLKDFPYIDVTGIQKTNKVFFFGWPTEDASMVYNNLDRNIGLPAECINANKFNIDRIVELLELNTLKNKCAKLKETISADNSNIISKKTSFVDILTNRAAVIILQYINDMLWIDRWEGTMKTKNDKKTFAKTDNFEKRWQTNGISLDTALKYVLPLGQSLVKYYENLIDLRYNPDMIKDLMATDLSKQITDFSIKAGYLGKK
jgi:hypothetical protein